MNPPGKTSAVAAKRLLLLFFLFVAAVFLIQGVLTLGVAQSTEERELKDKTPTHVPIKIKIKAEKEKLFKDLTNEHWLRDLEIEVTNTGDKPIYYLSLTIELPEVISPSGSVIGFPLRYGRHDLMDFRNRATPEDVPIQPGETYVFKVPENMVKGWEGLKSKQNPKKVELKFHVLHFGDGTGFHTTDGVPVLKKLSSNISKGD